MTEAGDQLMWYCSSCKRGSLKLHSCMDKLEHLSLEQVTKHDELLTKVSEVADVVDNDHQRNVEMETQLGNFEARLLALEVNKVDITLPDLLEIHRELKDIK